MEGCHPRLQQGHLCPFHARGRGPHLRVCALPPRASVCRMFGCGTARLRPLQPLPAPCTLAAHSEHGRRPGTERAGLCVNRGAYALFPRPRRCHVLVAGWCMCAALRARGYPGPTADPACRGQCRCRAPLTNPRPHQFYPSHLAPFPLERGLHARAQLGDRWLWPPMPWVARAAVLAAAGAPATKALHVRQLARCGGVSSCFGYVVVAAVCGEVVTLRRT